MYSEADFHFGGLEELSPPELDFESPQFKLDPRRSLRQTWWIRLGYTQEESAASPSESNLSHVGPPRTHAEPSPSPKEAFILRYNL